MTVFQNTKKLADTNISVEEDLSTETRKITMTHVVVERCPEERTFGFYENGQVVVNGKNLQSLLFVKNISSVMIQTMKQTSLYYIQMKDKTGNNASKEQI